LKYDELKKSSTYGFRGGC